MKLLLESDEFARELERDVKAARTCVYAQTLSFEADRGGNFLSNLYFERPGLDRRLIIDCYTRHILNDRFLLHPKNLLDRALRAEVKDTKDLLENLSKAQVKIKWVNPIGFLWRKISARNHKKIICVDHDIAFVGGINFSDHNFAWHDLMVRFDRAEGDGEIVDALRNDFLKTWDGENQGYHKDFHNVSLSLLDGSDSPKFCQPVLNLIRGAKKNIFVQSPYLSSPYYEALGEAASRGVEVSVVVPAQNNWGLYDQYTEWLVKKHGLKLFKFSKGMSHLKAIMVDDESVVVGSSNFDYFSYHLHQELMVIIRDPAFVKQFLNRVVEADLKGSKLSQPSVSEKEGRKAEQKMNRLFRLMHRLNR